MDIVPLILILLGFALLVTGRLWIAVRASRNDSAELGMVALLFGWAPIIYCVKHNDGWLQFGIFVLGILLFFAGAVMLKFV